VPARHVLARVIQQLARARQVVASQADLR
jgi:hypothetical protein